MRVQNINSMKQKRQYIRRKTMKLKILNIRKTKIMKIKTCLKNQSNSMNQNQGKSSRSKNIMNIQRTNANLS